MQAVSKDMEKVRKVFDNIPEFILDPKIEKMIEDLPENHPTLQEEMFVFLLRRFIIPFRKYRFISTNRIINIVVKEFKDRFREPLILKTLWSLEHWVHLNPNKCIHIKKNWDINP